VGILMELYFDRVRNKSTNKRIYKRIAIRMFLLVLTSFFLINFFDGQITLVRVILAMAFVTLFIPLTVIKDVFHPLVLYSAFQFFILLNFLDKVRVTDPSMKFFHLSLDNNDYYIIISLLIWITWHLLICMGYYYSSTFFKVKDHNKRTFINNLKIYHPKKIAYLLFFISVLSFLIILSKMGGISGMIYATKDSLNSYAGLVYFKNLVDLSVISSILFLYSNKRKLAVIVLLSSVVMMFFFGNRGSIVNAFIVYMLCSHYYYREVKINKLSLLVVFTLVFTQIMGSIRKYGSLTIQNLEISNLLFKAADTKDMANILPSIVGSLENGIINFQYGKDMFNILVAPIPRSIWENKPLIDESTIIGSMLIDSPIYWGLPPGPYGWMYLNFGWFGVIIAAFCTGIIIQKVYSAFLRNRESLTLYVLIYPFIVSHIPSVLNTSKQVQIIWYVGIMLIVYLIDKMFSTKRFISNGR
jgi:oligosaccharide repeat unit polymerase